MTGEHTAVVRVGEAGGHVTLRRAADGSVRITVARDGSQESVILDPDEFRWLVIMAGPTVLTLK